MTLNKDLFGNLIPEKTNAMPGTPVSVRSSGSTGGGMWVAHGTKMEPEEFMKAPLLHVGTADQAARAINLDWNQKEDDEGFPLYEHAGDVPGVHEMRLSKHAKIHPITFPDDIANEAHHHFVSDMGLETSPSVYTSKSQHGKEHPLVSRALKALQSNQVIRYNNTQETPDWDESSYDNPADARFDAYSYIVPSPSLNIAQFGQKDPQKQRMLPLDYTGVLPESETTKLSRLE
jgi:hypothetical protein